MVRPAYAHTVSDSETEIAMLHELSGSHAKVNAELEAAVAERRKRWEGSTQEQRTAAQKVRMQAELDAPLPAVAPFEEPVVNVMVGERRENHPEISRGSHEEYLEDREICKEHQNNRCKSPLTPSASR